MKIVETTTDERRFDKETTTGGGWPASVPLNSFHAVPTLKNDDNIRSYVKHENDFFFFFHFVDQGSR